MGFNDYYLELFCQTAIERHKIYLKKEAKDPKPWTGNPIFQNYFFCNVFRQYDKCSKWIIKNVIPLVNQDINNWPLIILYRYISTYEIFKHVEEVGQISNTSWIRNYLSVKRKEGNKIFNGCFIRNPRIKNGWVQTYEVPFYLIDEIQDFETFERMEPGGFLKEIGTLEDMTKFFSQFSATKGFMGYEYACDFEYTKYFNPVDKFTWCNKGPGAQKGLSWLINGTENGKFTDKEFHEYCSDLFIELGAAFKEKYPNEIFSMREVEHWLCEFQKYIKYYANYTANYKCKYRKYDGA